MDLLQTVRKEGSRGGRSEFKWEDVKSDAHRENYLGHSLMARAFHRSLPQDLCRESTNVTLAVGRWQKGRDLNWYARGDKGDMDAEAARKEELRRVKEAEKDAMDRALGFEVPERAEDRNANMIALGGEKGVRRAVKESVEEDEDEGRIKGVGFGTYGGRKGSADEEEVMAGSGQVEGGIMGREAVARKSRIEQEEKEVGRRRDRRDETSREREERRSRRRIRHDREERDRRHHHRSRTPERRRRDRSRSQERRRSRSRDRRGNDYERRDRPRRDRDEVHHGQPEDSKRPRSRSPHERRSRYSRGW